MPFPFESSCRTTDLRLLVGAERCNVWSFERPMASGEAADVGQGSKSGVKQSPRVVQHSHAQHADRTPRGSACPSPLRPRPSPAARIARSLRAALWPSTAQAQSPAAPGAVAEQADAAYAAALARVRQRAAALVAAVSGSPRKPARERGEHTAARPAPVPASSSFVLEHPLDTDGGVKKSPIATPSLADGSPEKSSPSDASDPQFWGRGEVGVDGPLTLHMRDSPALSGMLAGVNGEGAICAPQGTETDRDSRPSRSISFGREGAPAADRRD